MPNRPIALEYRLTSSVSKAQRFKLVYDTRLSHKQLSVHPVHPGHPGHPNFPAQHCMFELLADTLHLATSMC